MSILAIQRPIDNKVFSDRKDHAKLQINPETNIFH